MSRRSRLALRVVLALAGLALIVGLVAYSDPVRVAGALRQAGPWLPVVLLLEAGRIVVNALGLSLLYRRGGSPPLRGALWSASLPAALFAVVAPAGRLVAEAYRAARLSKVSGVATAAAAAAWIEAIVLLANAVIAVPTGIAALVCCRQSWMAWAVGVFCAGCLVAGIAVVVAGRARLGRWLGRHVDLAREAGPAFDVSFAQMAPAVLPALALEVVTRVFLVLQVVVLRYAVGATGTWLTSLATAGLLMTGAAGGDLVPAQLGTTDAPMTLAASVLGMRPTGALALTLGLHAAQLTVGVGAAVLAAAMGAALVLLKRRHDRQDP